MIFGRTLGIHLSQYESILSTIKKPGNISDSGSTFLSGSNFHDGQTTFTSSCCSATKY